MQTDNPKVMRLIKMTGGLGNQMFIYAFYLQMKKRYPKVRIDLSDMMHYHVHYGYELHRVFGLPHTEFCISQPLKKVAEFLFFKKIYERKQAPGSMEAFEKKYCWPLLYFKGFYQSEHFFADVRDEVRKAFAFDAGKVNARTAALLRRIDGDAHAVSLHVRRGDYLQPRHWAALGSICEPAYYRNALAEMERRMDRPSYYVFSDDTDWARENIPLPGAIYVDWNQGEESWQDMMLMSRCRHHIICNSTFSWWGAWLDPREDKTVIAPDRWSRHRKTTATCICPAGWVKVPIR